MNLQWILTQFVSKLGDLFVLLVLIILSSQLADSKEISEFSAVLLRGVRLNPTGHLRYAPLGSNFKNRG